MKKDVYDEQSTAIANRPQGGNKAGSSKAGFDKEEMMKKMQVAGTPGPAHQTLGDFVGNWKAEVKCWMEPGSEPNVSKATSKTNY